MRKIWITAHSGCEGTVENSPESICKGIELGADCIEFDVRMDPLGRMRLTHNELADYSDALPLETALEMIAESGVAVNCDLKEEKLLCPVIAAAEAAGIPREKLVISGSVDVGLLLDDPSLARRARIFLNIEQIFLYMMKGGPFPDTWEGRGAWFDEHFDSAAELIRRSGAECINPCFKMMTPERITACHARGIGLSLWTVNGEADQERLLREDLVSMTTRQVISALRLRREIRGY